MISDNFLFYSFVSVFRLISLFSLPITTSPSIFSVLSYLTNLEYAMTAIV